MSKLAALLLLATGLVLGGSTAAQAQCVTFGPTPACAKHQFPAVRVDGPAPSFQIATRVRLEPASPRPVRVHAIDCHMAAPADPSFDSAMPVLTPDPKVNLPTTAVRIPGCSAPKK